MSVEPYWANGMPVLWWVNFLFIFFCVSQLMETSGADILRESDSQAPLSPLHLAVSLKIWEACLKLSHPGFSYFFMFQSQLDLLVVCLSFNQAYHGHCGALEVLLASLLDVDVRGPDGRTPLSLASSRGHQECVSLLVHHGASPMTRDYIYKKTALHAAGIITKSLHFTKWLHLLA